MMIRSQRATHNTESVVVVSLAIARHHTTTNASLL